jgi:hypothetical protein
MIPKIPFYTLSQEDHRAFLLQEKGKIDKNGCVINQGSLEELDYEISLDICVKLAQLFKKTISIDGRCCSIPLGITVSLQEVNDSLCSISHKKIRVIFQGSGMLSFITPLMERIFTKWCDDSNSEESYIFTPLFKSIIPNDYDFKFELDEAGDNEAIVNKGLVELLAEKVKKKVFRPDLLALELDKYKNKITDKSTQSYAKKIFAAYPRIRASLPDLHVLFVKAFAFQKAADVSTPGTRFSERKMGESQSLSYDCLFSKRTLQTTTPLNSLYIEVTDLLEGKEGNLTLQSTLGPKKRLQALSDANLRIMTFDPKKPAERGDFVRTISFFTIGGRCYQEGWLEKIIVAFESEVKLGKKMDFPELLAAQLIGRLIDHHQNEPAVLVALAFNASALLLTLRPRYTDEIQKLWRLIFAHLDKIEETFHHVMSQPFVEHVQMIMRDPSFNFEDLYCQIQVSTALKQNCFPIPYDKYPCKSTQTDGRIFNQIQVTIPRSENDKTSSLIFFFPANLLGAIQYLNRFIHLPVDMAKSLRRLHEVLIDCRSLAFSFGNLQLKEYFNDPRRTYLECSTHAKQLLILKHEHSWLMGYLLMLAFLAQKNEIKASKDLLISFLKMLHEKWASENFKKEAIEILHQTLSHSGITSELIFNGLEKKTTLTHILNWIQTSIKSDWAPLSHLAFEYMDKIEKEKNDEECVVFYNEIIKRYMDSNSGPVEEATLKVLIPRIALHAKLPLDSKLSWIFRLLSNHSLITVVELSQILFNNLVEVFKKVNKFEKQQKSNTLNELLSLLENKKFSVNAFSMLSLAQEIFRLKFLEDSNDLYAFWDQLVSRLPESTEMAILYQEKCQNLADGFKLWDTLDNRRKQAFTQLFIHHIEKQQKENKGCAETISKIDLQAIGQEAAQQTMQVLVNYNLVEKLKADSYAEDEIYILFALLRRVDWNLTDNVTLFEKTVLKLSSISTRHLVLDQIRDIVCRFQESYFQKQTQLLPLYLDLLKSIANTAKASLLGCFFCQVFLESIFSLLILTKERKNLLKIHYVSYVSNISNILKISKPTDTLRQLFRDNSNEFFRHLNQRELWGEIVELYLSIQPYLENSLKVNEILLKASTCCAAVSIGKKYSLEQFNQILDQIALENEQELSEAMGILCGSLFDACEDLKDFSGALQCLERQKFFLKKQDEFFCDRLFRIALEIIRTENHRAVYDPLSQLETPLNYELKWLDIIKLLLEKKQIDFCLKLIESKIDLLGMQNEKFNQEWINLLDRMLEEGEELFEAEDKLSLKQKKSLYTIIHQVMWRCLPKDENQWEKYRCLVTQKGPLKVVEEIFGKISNSDFEELPFLGKDLKINFWKSVLYRFSTESSTAILEPNNWWPMFCKISPLSNVNERLDMGKNFIYAAHLALEKNKSKEKAQTISNLFMTYKGQRTNLQFIKTAAEKDPMLLIYLAKIKVLVRDPVYFFAAIYDLLTIFDQLKNDPDPLIKEECLQFMNRCIKMSNSYYRGNSQISRAIRCLVMFISHDEHFSSDANYFPVLNYLHQTEMTHFEREADAGFRATNQYLKLKSKLVKLIVKNPWKEKPATQKQKDLVCETITQIYSSNVLQVWYSARKFIHHPDLSVYVTNNKSIRKKIKIIKDTRLSYFETSLAKMLDDTHTLMVLKSRISLSKEYEYRFKLLKNEKRALISQFKRLFTMLSIVIVVVGVSWAVFSDISSRSRR